jgi:hypothetical protein
MTPTQTDEAFAGLVATADDLHALNSADALERARSAEIVIQAAERAVRLAHEAKRASVVELVGTGLTYRAVAALVGMSHQRVSQIVAAAREDWGPVPVYTAQDHLNAARDAFRAAQVAQESRCEEYAMGYREETAAFYGSPKVATYEGAETRIGWAGFHVGQQRQEDEQS